MVDPKESAMPLPPVTKNVPNHFPKIPPNYPSRSGSLKVHVEAGDRCIMIFPLAGQGLRGIGRSLADGEDATDYVRRLRAEWNARP